MSAHWYSRQGQLMQPVATKAGGIRDYDLRDARKDGSLPSVTTMLATLDKPGLRAWSNGQIINSAWKLYDGALGYPDNASILSHAFRVVDEAAAFGSEVHAAIASSLRNIIYLPADPRVRLVLNAFWSWHAASGLKVSATEQSFANTEWGYAGTADYLGTWCGEPCIVDFKTQDGDSAADLLLYDPEHPLQLAGYALGLGEQDRKRISVIISRTRPGLVKLHVWPDNDRYISMWVHLLAFWQHSKNYYPGTVVCADSISGSRVMRLLGASS